MDTKRKGKSMGAASKAGHKIREEKRVAAEKLRSKVRPAKKS